MGKFDWFGVYPIVQHPTFVVINAQTQLLLLVTICPSRILKPLLVAISLLPSNAELKRSHVISFCFFDVPFVLNFFFSPSGSSMK